MPKCVTNGILLFGRARFFSFVQRIAIRGNLYWKTTNLFHMSNPTGFRLKTIFALDILLNFLVSSQNITSIRHNYRIDFIQKSTRKVYCYFVV